MSAEFAQLDLFATQEHLRSLTIRDLGKTGLISPLHVLPVFLGDDHGCAYLLHFRRAARMISVIVREHNVFDRLVRQ